MPENSMEEKPKNQKLAAFRQKSAADKKRAVSDLLFNNAMYIIIVLAIIFIAIRVPAFLSLSSIINIISLTAAKLPIALGIGGAIVLTGTDISAGRAVGLTACIAASMLQIATYPNKMFPGIKPFPLWVVLVSGCCRFHGGTCPQKLLRTGLSAKWYPGGRRPQQPPV